MSKLSEDNQWVMPWFQFLHLRCGGTADEIPALQEETFVCACLGACLSFSEISWQNFCTNLEIFYKLIAFGVLLNVRTLLSLWPCEMVTMTTAALDRRVRREASVKEVISLDTKIRPLCASLDEDIIRMCYLWGICCFLMSRKIKLPMTSFLPSLIGAIGFRDIYLII